MQILTHLINEARALAGDNLCLLEHDWSQEGQRPCPTGNQSRRVRHAQSDCAWRL